MNTISRNTPDALRSEGDVRLANLSDELVFPPGGPRRRSRMRHVRPGETVRLSAESGLRVARLRLRRSDAPGPPDQANWITYAGWLNTTGDPVSQFVSTWTVPPAPDDQSSQLLYLFNGMQTADGQIIVQLVLQWGDHGADNDGVNRTGPFWTAASWIVGGPDASATHSHHVPVNPGDILVGAITLTNQSPNGFVYSCEFQGLPDTQFSTDAMAELVWCVETLEVYELQGNQNPPYDLNDASEYPAGSVTFTDIGITTSAPGPSGQWTKHDLVSQYGENTSISTNSTSDGEIVITF
jgi:hypothetical protein